MTKRPEFWIAFAVLILLPYYMTGFSAIFLLALVCAAGLWGVSYGMRRH